MKKWEPQDVIVLIMATTVCVLLIMSFIKPFITDISLSENAAKLLASIITSIISIISVYIGSKMKQR